MRREFITGFYGSAGEAVITLNKAVFWTDGRYYIQADYQLDCNWILMKRGREDVSSTYELVFKNLKQKNDLYLYYKKKYNMKYNIIRLSLIRILFEFENYL